MKNKEGYLEWLKGKIERLHNCDAIYRETVPVHVVCKSKKIWPSEVEVFSLSGHPTAKRAYAWGHPEAYTWFESDDGITPYTIVLEMPPVDSAQKAAQVMIDETEQKLREIYKDAKKEMKEQFSKPYPPTN